MKPDFSLVICTKNRSCKLEHCLKEVNKLNADNLTAELVIIDNNSTDNTQQIINNFKHKSKFKVTSEIEKKAGSGIARNRGISIAKGKIIVFVDDDCYLENNYLQIVNSRFEDSKMGFIGGKVLLYDKTDMEMTIQRSDEREEYNKLQLLAPSKIMGANLCIRKEALTSVNGFDPLLGSGTRFVAEDIDCVYRVLAKGWKGLYEPELVVYHHHGRNSIDEITELLKGYDRGLGVYLFKSFFNPFFKLMINLQIIKYFVFRRPFKRTHMIQGIIVYIYLRILNSCKGYTYFES